MKKTVDQEIWFEPKMAVIRGFMKTTKNWIASEHEIILPVEKVLQEENVVDYLQETVKPNDSVSQVGVSDVTQASTRRSQVSRTSAVSRVSSARARQEAEHAALLERAAALRKCNSLSLKQLKSKLKRKS